MSDTFKFGPIGSQVDVPYPQSGMAFSNNVTNEVTNLLSGGQAVWRAATTYKSFNMSWKGGLKQGSVLQPFIDVYQGMYGPGPYYLVDPLAGGNYLPPRWASAYQLEAISNGWCNPYTSNQSVTPEGQQSTFTGNTSDASEGISIVTPAIDGEPFYLKVWGSVTGSGAGIRVYLHSSVDGSWTLGSTVTPGAANADRASIMSGSNYDAVRLVLYVPNGTTMTLQHMELTTTNTTDSTRPFLSGSGVGAVQFAGNLGGTLTSTAIDRIGLSVDLREVERDANYS